MVPTSWSYGGIKWGNFFERYLAWYLVYSRCAKSFFFYNYHHHPKMSLSNQKWLSAPGTAYDFCFDQEVHKTLLKLFHTARVPLSALSAEKVSQMHELQHVLDREVEKGRHRMSRNKNHRDKRCWKAGQHLGLSQWVGSWDFPCKTPFQLFYGESTVPSQAIDESSLI